MYLIEWAYVAEIYFYFMFQNNESLMPLEGVFN